MGGVAMMVASLPLTNKVDVPIFLTPEEHGGLVRFLTEEPCGTNPQLLLLVAACKAGKSTLLMHVIEGLVTALRIDDARMQARPPPVFFRFAFDSRCDVEAAARDLAGQLRDFALSQGIRLQQRDSDPIGHVADVAKEVAASVHFSGRELWLLIDEAQGPVLGSTLAGSDAFVAKFKKVRAGRGLLLFVRAQWARSSPTSRQLTRPTLLLCPPISCLQLVDKCSPYGRIVVTGTSMAALLNAVRKHPPNSFTLWDAAARLQLGREPPRAAAVAMAERILASYLHRWPPEARRVITAERLVAELQGQGVDQVLSPRPALIAYVAGLVGDARSGSAEEVVVTAVRQAAEKVVMESSLDVTRLLLTTHDYERTVLRRIADGELHLPAQPAGTLCDQLEPLFSSLNLARLVASLCESEWPLRLVPPYGTLLRSWIESDGRLAFKADGYRLELLPSIHSNLVFINDLLGHIPRLAAEKASDAVLEVLVQHGLGIRDAAGGMLRAPRTASELRSIPAIAAVMYALDEADQDESQMSSPHVQHLSSQRLLGLWCLRGLRHVPEHAYFCSPHILRNGITAATVTAAVRAAAAAIVSKSDGVIHETQDGVLALSAPVNRSAHGAHHSSRWPS